VASCKGANAPQYEGAIQRRKALKVTERKVPAIVLGGSSAGGDGAIHDPLLHPEFYEGVALRRMFAFFLDMLLIGIIMIVAVIAATALAIISLGLLAIPAFLFGTVALGLLYDVFTIGGPASATPGMRVFGLKVITWSGGRPDTLQAFLMSALFWAIHGLTGWLAAVVVFLNPRWRCAHDFLAGTVVVRSDIFGTRR
jgi:uncharacterized RDD family membrane protein YckC